MWRMDWLLIARRLGDNSSLVGFLRITLHGINCGVRSECREYGLDTHGLPLLQKRYQRCQLSGF